VTRIIVPALDLQNCEPVLKLTEQYAGVFAAMGIHPNATAVLTDNWLQIIKSYAQHPKVVAIGEIGLDYYRDLSPRARQRAAFEAQLALAADLGLPVIIHQRESAMDVMASLRAWAEGEHPDCVLHAFSGDEAMAYEAVSLGFLIGVGGPVTFKNARRLPEIVPRLPLNCLVIETDAPYLAPHPHRGKRNEPAYMALVAERLAQLRGLSLDELACQVTENTLRLFRLPSATWSVGDRGGRG
jgi:TatD DNase family protein